MAFIYIYGEIIYIFVECSSYVGLFLLGFVAMESLMEVKLIGFKYVDYCVGNVEFGQMNEWVKFYQDVMGFKLLVIFDDKDIFIKYIVLMSKVVFNGNGYIKFFINEFVQGLKKFQIEEYLDYYCSVGVQYIVIVIDDIIYMVDELCCWGVDFLCVLDIYYEMVLDWVGEINESLQEFKCLNIFIDWDDEGYLLQIFIKLVQDCLMVFYEIIQWEGVCFFGKGNFKALFEVIEWEQELRGMLQVVRLW